MKLLTDYQGRAVRLTPEREQHIAEHPEMGAMMDELEKTLNHPEHVI